MKVRVRFSKTGPIRYTGHLDFMRTFQKAVKKSGLPAVYSAGFNPHMLIGFAAPLGVGEETTGDYADIEFAWKDPCPLSEQDAYRLKDIGLDNDALPPAPSGHRVVEILNAAMPPGTEVTGAVRIGQTRSSKAMALVRFASWELWLPASFLPGLSGEELGRRMEDFAALEKILILKKTKNAEKTVDIRPMIRSLRAGGKPLPEFLRTEASGNGRVISLTCSGGSTENLKPEAVLEAFCAENHLACPWYGCRVVRTETFDERMKTLLELGTEF